MPIDALKFLACSLGTDREVTFYDAIQSVPEQTFGILNADFRSVTHSTASAAPRPHTPSVTDESWFGFVRYDREPVRSRYNRRSGFDVPCGDRLCCCRCAAFAHSPNVRIAFGLSDHETYLAPDTVQVFTSEMPPRPRRGASANTPSAAQYKRLVIAVEHLTAVVERLCADLDALRNEQRVQVIRAGQLQVELDEVKHAWTKMTPPIK
jgi:hypothetical protein